LSDIKDDRTVLTMRAAYSVGNFVHGLRPTDPIPVIDRVYAANFVIFFARTPVKVQDVLKWTNHKETLLLVNKMRCTCRGSTECNVCTFRS
jgi:hypothetical protein